MSATAKPQRTRNKHLNEERERKRFEAGVRQEIYNKLTTQEKLDKLGNLVAAKQRIKLHAKLAEEAAVKFTPPKKAAKK